MSDIGKVTVYGAVAPSEFKSPPPNADREYGYYWVRTGMDEWHVAQFTKHGWYATGCEEPLPDYQLDEIGEKIPNHD
jgi:hypothetical protein